MTSKIAELERDLWRVIFSNPAKSRFPIEVVKKKIQASKEYDGGDGVLASLQRIGRLSGRGKSKRSKAFFEKALSECASLLTKIDIDRELAVAATKVAVAKSTVRSAEGHRRVLAHGRKVKAASRVLETLRNEFIEANQGLVVLIAGRYRWAKLPMNDLIQEGNLGLIKAVNRFDHEKGYQFSTYASWWIQSAIGRSIDNKEAMIRIPSSAMRNRSRLRNALRVLTQRTGRNPTDEEIRAETGMGRLKLERAKRNVNTHILSLDQKVSESNSLRYQDILPNENDLGPFEATLVTSMAKDMVVHLKTLSQLERSVLAYRFGLDDCDVLTLQEIAEQYGLSRERIRQIQNHAIAKLREKMSLTAA